MTLKLFDEWIISLDKLMLKENRRILMFLDNCTSHSTSIQNKLANVKLIFLPANSTLSYNH